MKLSKSQFKKQRRKERAKEQRKILKKNEVICLNCASISNELQWKHNGKRCPNCNFDRFF